MLKSVKTLYAVFLFILIVYTQNVSGAPLPVDLMVTNALVVGEKRLSSAIAIHSGAIDRTAPFLSQETNR
jgi:hypothetical protein